MLYEHQKAAIRACIENPRRALYHEQGLGKTITAIITADYCLKIKQSHQITVICPAFLQNNWREELKRWSKNPEDYRIFSYEKFSTHAQLVQKSDFIIVDEAHYIKNRKAKRTQVVVDAILRTPRVLLLTGTPIGNGDILDLYTHLLCLDPSNPYSRYSNFFKQFVAEKAHRFDKLRPRQEAIPQFMSLIEPFSERKTKEECLDIPEKIYQTLTCKGTRAEKYLHVSHKMQLQEGFTVNVQNKDDSGAVIDTQTYQSTSEKLKTLMAHIDCIPERAQIVVYVAFLRSLDLIAKELGKEKITYATFSGNLSEKEKNSVLQRFKNNEFRILVATIQSLNVGVTLTNCHNVIYYSRTFSVTERVQSEDRFHRIGQRNCVNYTDIVAEGVDKRAYEMLKENKSYDDIVREIEAI